MHVVSDRRVPLHEAVVAARLSWPGDERSWRWTGDVAADSCVRIGRVLLESLPSTAVGPIVLQLTLTHPSVTATNRYEGELLPRV